MTADERKARPKQGLREEVSLALSERWTKEHYDAVADLKAALTNAPFLEESDISPDAKPMQLYMDASKKGLGACLQQKGTDGELRVIGYESKALNAQERIGAHGRLKLTPWSGVWSVFSLALRPALHRLHGPRVFADFDGKPLRERQVGKVGNALVPI